MHGSNALMIGMEPSAKGNVCSSQHHDLHVFGVVGVQNIHKKSQKLFGFSEEGDQSDTLGLKKSLYLFTTQF